MMPKSKSALSLMPVWQITSECTAVKGGGEHEKQRHGARRASAAVRSCVRKVPLCRVPRSQEIAMQTRSDDDDDSDGDRVLRDVVPPGGVVRVRLNMLDAMDDVQRAIAGVNLSDHQPGYRTVSAA